MASGQPRSAEHRLLPCLPDADAGRRPAARRKHEAGGARRRARLVRRLSRRADLPLQAGARASGARFQRPGPRGGAAARQLSLRGLLWGLVHRGTVPVRLGGRLLAHAAAAVLAGRRVGAAGRADTPERRIPQHAARADRPDGRHPPRDGDPVARVPRRSRAAGVSRTGPRRPAVFTVHLSAHWQPVPVGRHSGSLGTHVRSRMAVARRSVRVHGEHGFTSTCAPRRRTS